MSKEVVYTQEELEARCKVWQERLRLQDWEVLARLATRRELEDDHRPIFPYGDCERHLEDMRARIRIVQAEDYSHVFGIPQDMEEILVHELLHITFAGVRGEDLNEVAGLHLEAGLNVLSELLVRTFRRIEQLESEVAQRISNVRRDG